MKGICYGPEGGKSTPLIRFPASKPRVAKIIMLLRFPRNSFVADPQGGNRPPRFYFRPRNIKLQKSRFCYFLQEIYPLYFIPDLKTSSYKNHDFAMFLQKIRLWRTRRGEIDPLDFISDLKTSSCKNHDFSMFLKEIRSWRPRRGEIDPADLFRHQK